MRQAPFDSVWPFPDEAHHAGQFVSLVRLDIARDAAELYRISHASEPARALWEYLPQGPFASLDGFVESLEAMERQPDRVVYTVRRQPDGAAVGTISVMRIVPKDGVSELGSIWYAPVAQRTAANTEAVYLLLRYLFDTLGYRRVEWKCDARNARSAAAAVRLGFTFEGCFRQHMVIKQANRDTLWYAMLDAEWPQKCANFERALYAGEGVSLRLLNETPR